MVMGITGKSGSGKTYMAKTICAMMPNAVHIDFDTVAHQVLEYKDVSEKIVELFSESVMTGGAVDRKKLRNVFFNNRDSCRVLMKLVWGHMDEIIENLIMDNLGRDIILDWIFLPFTPYWEDCTVKCLVECPAEIRMQRATARDRIADSVFLARDSASKEYDGIEFHLTFNNKEQFKEGQKEE